MRKLLLLLTASAALCVQASATRVTLDDLAKTVRVSDPQISPDGKSILVVVGRANLKEDRYDSDLVLVEVASRRQRVLVHAKPGLGFARWSPAGDRIAYLAKVGEGEHKTSQIFILPMAGGEPLQWTSIDGSVGQIAWRPDGQALAFVASDETPKRKPEEKNDDAFEIRNNDYLTASASMSTHLWVTGAPSGGQAGGQAGSQPEDLTPPEPRRLTKGDWSLPISFPPGAPASPVNWSADGKQIVFVRAESPLSGDAELSSIQLIDVATGQTRPLTGRKTLEGYPLFSPDGQTIAYWLAHEGKQWLGNDVYLTPATATTEGRNATPTLDRNVERVLWMPDGKHLLVGANDGTGVGLWLQPAAGGPAKRLSTGNVVPSSAFWVDVAVGPKQEIAFAGATPDHATELYFMPSPAAAPVRLTNFNAYFDTLERGRSEVVTWATDLKDPMGKPVMSDGVLTYPPGYSAAVKYPLVLVVHGGPTANTRDVYNVNTQQLAAHGWMVFEPNYRGSDNLGNLFQGAIWNDAGAGPGRDVMAGVAMVKARGSVDESRMAVSGWSYGGYMTTWLLGNYPTVWKAAVAGAAVTDWVDMYTLSDGVTTIGDNFGGSPYKGDLMKEYQAQSPITYANRITAPTLVLSDTGDARVPITQSYKLFRVLKDNGVTTRFFAWPIAGHGPADPLRRRDVQKRWTEWLSQYLDATPTPARVGAQ